MREAAPGREREALLLELTMLTEFTGQNDAVITPTTQIKVTGCKKAKPTRAQGSSPRR
jgi:hypothetical protein